MLLLADIFEEIRNMCINNYKLDLAHYYTIPGLSWDAIHRRGIGNDSKYRHFNVLRKGDQGRINAMLQEICKGEQQVYGGL